MRYSNRRFCCLRILTCICMSAVACARVAIAQPPRPPEPDSISLRADSASEDRNARSLRMEGNVRVNGNDWVFTAERATISGSLDRAELLHAEGAPARIFFRNAGTGADINEVEGFAPDISYRRHEDVLHLRGGASLRRDAHTLTSDDIEYRRENDLFKAEGAGGVRLTVTPGRRRSADTPPQH